MVLLVIIANFVGINNNFFLAMTPVARIVRDFEDKNCLKFTPNRQFYSKVNINQKRYSKLLKGNVENITLKEIVALCRFFGKEPTKLIPELLTFINQSN